MVANATNPDPALTLYACGDGDEKVQRWLEACTFLTIKTLPLDLSPPDELYFIVCALDFAVVRQVQDLVRVFSSHDGPLSHKIAVALAPEVLPQEILLLLQELGTNHVTFGAQRHESLRQHLQRVWQERHQRGALADVEVQLEQAFACLDMDSVRRLIVKLQQLPATEAVLQRMAHASLFVGERRLAEAALKAMLQLNGQNLWAANTLGKLYLRSGRAAVGIETLRKLSSFHDLNADRLLTLGNAATLAGQMDVAEEALNKGHRLVASSYPRFEEGLAKLKLAQHDLKGAMQVLAGRGFSEDIVSFLNMRAILAIRSGRFDEGIRYYDYALTGCAEQKSLQARIKFNIGLAYARHDALDKAYAALVESQKLGGQDFQRAQGPLEIISKLIKKGGSQAKEDLKSLAENVEWETLY